MGESSVPLVRVDPVSGERQVAVYQPANEDQINQNVADAQATLSNANAAFEAAKKEVEAAEQALNFHSQLQQAWNDASPVPDEDPDEGSANGTDEPNEAGSEAQDVPIHIAA